MTSDGPPSTTLPFHAGVLSPFRDGADRMLALIQGNPIRSGVVLGALLLMAVAGAPLASHVWEAFWSLPYAGRIMLCGIGLTVLVTASVGRSRLQLRQRAEQARLGSVIAVAWAVVIAVVGFLVAGAWWVMGAPTLNFPDPMPPRALDALATRAFAVVAGLGAAALLVIHYRRQRTTEADAERAEQAAQREVTKLYNERFTSAYTELGNEHAAVRLGAVHALAHLADDAPSEEEVQMVIDVLCAYLRMPYTYAPVTAVLPDNASMAHREEHREQELKFASFREVRHTIIRIIGNRLREPTRWRGKDYDFTGVVFDGGDFHGAVFAGGTVSFGGAEFSGSRVNFGRAKFTGGTVDFGKAKFTSDIVDFRGAEFSGGWVLFLGAEVSGGTVHFGKAGFSGSTVHFNRAAFANGTVHFSEAEFSGGTVGFDRASGTCPVGLLEAIEHGAPEVVVLPGQWQPATNTSHEQEEPSASVDATDK